MVTSCASIDSKYKAILPAAGREVYASCDSTAQNVTWQSVLLELTDMDGDNKYTSEFQLIKEVVDTNAKDSPN